MQVLVAGNTVLDLHITVPDEEISFGEGWADNNVQFLDRAPKAVLGGNGAATAYALGRLGVSVSLNSSIGNDVFGDLVLGWLNDVGVRLVKQNVGPTAVNFVRSRASDGSRTSSFFPGEKLDWSAGLDQKNPDWFFASGYGRVSKEDFGLLVDAFGLSRRRGSRIVFDPGPWFSKTVSKGLFRSRISVVDCLTGTGEELGVWSDESSPSRVIEDYLRLGVPTVIVKRGTEGASYGDRAGALGHIKGNPIHEVHAVGAGDTFNGTLIAGLCADKPLDVCVDAAVHRAERAVRSGEGVLGAFD
jgi:sugar/nucleoside kinase (ribokinase family)